MANSCLKHRLNNMIDDFREERHLIYPFQHLCNLFNTCTLFFSSLYLIKFRHPKGSFLKKRIPF